MSSFLKLTVSTGSLRKVDRNVNKKPIRNDGAFCFRIIISYFKIVIVLLACSIDYFCYIIIQRPMINFIKLNH